MSNLNLQTEQLLAIIAKAQTEFILNMDLNDLFSRLLGSLLSITESEYGFIGEIFYDPSGNKFLKTHAISDISWNEATKKIYQENRKNGFEFRNLQTLFGAVMTTERTVISNAPSQDPRAGGIPPGHPPLKSFMGIPFFSGTQMTGMIGIANRPDGYTEEISDFLTPFLFTCGNLIQAHKSNIDKVRMEQNLKDKEAHSQAILATVASGIITIDEHCILRDFNPAAERIFGYSAVEVIGKNINFLMPEPYRTEHDSYVSNYLKTNVRKIIGIGREVHGRRKDGTIFPLDLSVNEFNVGEKKYFVGVLTDITARKKTEESLITAKNAAEDASRLKTEFINVISHELMTPLTVILGNISLLNTKGTLPESEEIRDIASDIEENGKHLLKLINKVLDISRLEAGRIEMKKEFCAADLIVYEAMETIKSQTEKKNLKLASEIQKLNFFADPFRIRQILDNLLENAVKFTDSGQITVHLFQMKDQICFEIADTGCGIKEKDLLYIFDKFRQVDGSVTRKAEGSGLGLTISKKIADLHGGRISVSSEPGKGSRFTLLIPISSTG